MTSFREDVQRASDFHGHLCSGQCVGIKMARMGMRLIGIDNQTDRKKLMVFVECNRCPADAILMTTGCRIGKRTYYFQDFGKVAATFVNLESGKAVRIVRFAHRHPPEGADMISYYENLPDEEFLSATEVEVPLGRGDLPGPPAEVVVCEVCGEEVLDCRHIEKDGRILCKGCAGVGYYRVVENG